MKRTSIFILIISMMLIFQACHLPEDVSTTASSTATETIETTENAASTAEATEPAPTISEIYNEMMLRWDSLESVKVEINSMSTTTLGLERFEEKEKQTLILQNIGTDRFAASMTQTVDWEYFWVDISEVFVGDKVYFTVMPNDQHLVKKYSAAMTSDEYLAKSFPVEMFDIQRYATVENPTTNTLTFSDAYEPEEWFGIGEGEFISVDGRVYLAKDCMPERITYKLVYRQGSAEIERFVTMEIVPETGAAIVAPGEIEQYQTLEGAAVYGPYLQVHALGFLAQANVFSSTLCNVAASEAGACSYEELAQIHLFAGEKLTQGKRSGTVRLRDYQTGTYYYDDAYEQTYQNGTYESRYNGDLEFSEKYSYADYFSYLFDDIFAWIPYPSETESYLVANYGGTILVEYDLSEAFVPNISTEVTGLMFAEADTLDKLASAYRTEMLKGYVGIDVATGIPTVIGTEYIGVHTIDGYDYRLSYSAMTNVMVGHESTYEELTGEAMATTDEVEEITPLFYHVTGNNGQEMWLLGTIHVGDRRTSNLPKQIGDAFAASDALAVEFDISAFEEQLLADAELAEQVAALYCYTDGTTIQDHISDMELYGFAAKRLLAAGKWNNTMPLYKPVAWSQLVDDYLMSWNYELSAEHGMDLKLLNMAGEQGKKILDVESGIEQLSMLAGFSSQVQEMLLGSSLMTTPVLYVSEINKMYELWCVGDEQELMALIKPEEMPEMSEEEKALYEEYTKAMYTDRDKGMLKTAKQYLESGETVFYAVGLAHLLSEDGLVNALQEAGYTVEQVTYP